MKIKYFNITYKCNSKCLFCAANIGLHHENDIDMTYKKFVGAIEESELQQGDRVILNGGEPTVCTDFLEIIKYCASKKLYIDIYSNGKRFSDALFCNKVIKEGNLLIRIPLFGMQDSHDFLTGRQGNFICTINGLINLLSSDAFKSGRLKIEVKLLLAKCCIKGNEKVLDYLYSIGILNKVEISLNPLLLSEKVMLNGELFLDTYANMIKESEPLFFKAKEYKKEISLNLLPFCCLTENILKTEIERRGIYNEILVAEYNDGNDKRNSDILKRNHSRISYCDGCKLEPVCSKYPQSYLDVFGEEQINIQFIDKVLSG